MQNKFNSLRDQNLGRHINTLALNLIIIINLYRTGEILKKQSWNVNTDCLQTTDYIHIMGLLGLGMVGVRYTCFMKIQFQIKTKFQ